MSSCVVSLCGFPVRQAQPPQLGLFSPGVLAPGSLLHLRAAVTTAALHHEDQENFAPGETGYKVLKNELRDYQTGQWSPNFDSLGFAADFNTLIPLDRLDELAEQAIIGKVSDIHLSYSGVQYDLSAVRMDSGPAGAKLLKDAGVDVVLLTPV